ncbi:NAD(P)/FAD-dependent oxidoreductase [Patescibacteria group bacterium AH-259-L05]|nr:NAD(P)/FAD-dependent oxidoreductase [Patescibacteria group bacterium AH-259-L05]
MTRIVIIGAGVLGTAISYTLKKCLEDTVDVLLLEKHDGPGQETSQFNSGVLHSGIHSEPKSFKARFARKGNVMAKQFCKDNDVPLSEQGMLIVATYGDLVHLAMRGRDFLKMYHNGKDQGINMKILMSWNIPHIEPYIRGAGALYIPSVAVVDSVAFVQALFRSAKEAGARSLFNTKVVELEAVGERYHIRTEKFADVYDMVINAAGLYADEIAKMAGFNQYTVYPYRGEYYEVLGKERELVNRLIYPVPITGSAGKGIHFLKKPDGRLFLGPNARLVPTKEYYEEDKTPPEVFRDAAVRFCSDLKNAELRWAYSGIRPKVVQEDELHNDPDFIFSVDNEKPFLLNIIGYESPGLSGALAAAEYVKDVVNKYIKSR